MVNSGETNKNNDSKASKRWDGWMELNKVNNVESLILLIFFNHFRMEFDDFKANYDRVEICNMTPDALTENTKRHWEVNMFEGSWIRGSTAGGCRNFIGENS